MLTQEFGYPIEFSEANPQAGNLVVLLHGFGASSFSWRGMFQRFAVEHHVISYDRPGFGFTPLVSNGLSPDPYSLDGQVYLLRQILTARANGRPMVLVGHSAGGLLAAEYALRYPGEITALVLESPAIWRKPPPIALLAKLARAPWIEAWGSRRLKGFEKLGMRILSDSFSDTGKLTQATGDGYRAPMTLPDWTTRLWRFITASQRNQVRSNLWRLDTPTFVVSGDSDRIVKVEDTFRVAERIPGHSIYLVPNCGHIAHEEQPDDFWRVVSGFLSKALQRGRADA